jgi:hypothetical protein
MTPPYDAALSAAEAWALTPPWDRPGACTGDFECGCDACWCEGVPDEEDDSSV